MQMEALGGSLEAFGQQQVGARLIVVIVVIVIMHYAGSGRVHGASVTCQVNYPRDSIIYKGKGKKKTVKKRSG